MIVKQIAQTIPDHMAQLLRLLVVTGFFAFAGLCIAVGRRNDRLRRVFVGVLVAGLLVPTLTGIMFPPFANWYFFSDPAPQNRTTHTIFVVDADGDEFDYPAEAAPPGDYGRAEPMVKGTGFASPDRMAAYLLDRARKHRKSLRDGLSVLEFVEYRSVNGRLIGRDAWTVSEARAMDELVGLRIYRSTLNTSTHGYKITRRNRTAVYEYWASDP